MADIKTRLPTNAEGDFFVDASCIDCGTCRWMAPDAFDRARGHSRVHAQPTDARAEAAALRALVACPVAAIGTARRHDVATAAASFPYPIGPDVYHCGFHHRASYGAASYLIARAAGNVLIDSPRFAGPLVGRLEEMGGVDLMFLTHRDDVADHARFAAHFGCRRILHAADVTAGTRGVEIQPDGTTPLDLAPDLRVIPTPGHTRGSSCLLYNGSYLFTGDHLAWNLARNQLYAFSGACWFDWDTQVESMRRLVDLDFAHVLPGHGAPCHLPAPQMRAQLQACVTWMAAQASP